MTTDGDGLLERQAALQRALASKHDPNSRMTRVCLDRENAHSVDGGRKWCIDELCPINRAAAELRSLGISP